MTEEEKIFSGHIFNNRCSELVEIKRRTHRLCREYNRLDETDPARTDIMRQVMGSIGRIFYFQGPLQFNYGCHTFIGENFFANFNLVVMDDARVFIGDNVCIGPNVSLLATNHPLLPQERLGLSEEGRMTMAEFAEDIHIGNNVWIAANVAVLGGVHIGDNVVIGAGSVVTEDIPDNYLAFGVPCKPVRPITDDDSQAWRILPEDRDFFRNNMK